MKVLTKISGNPISPNLGSLWHHIFVSGQGRVGQQTNFLGQGCAEWLDFKLQHFPVQYLRIGPYRTSLKRFRIGTEHKGAGDKNEQRLCYSQVFEFDMRTPNM